MEMRAWHSYNSLASGKSMIGDRRRKRRRCFILKKEHGKNSSPTPIDFASPN
jgi:hypothetical protein